MRLLNHVSFSHSVVSDSAVTWTVTWLLFCPWNSPGRITGVGCHSLLQEVFLSQQLKPLLPYCRQILYCLSHEGSPSFQYYSVSTPQSNYFNIIVISILNGLTFLVPAHHCLTVRMKNRHSVLMLLISSGKNSLDVLSEHLLHMRHCVRHLIANISNNSLNI